MSPVSKQEPPPEPPVEAGGLDTSFRSLLESAPDAILIVDQEGRIVLANGQAERLFGYTRAELLGQPHDLLVPAGIREAHSAHRSDYASHPRTRPMGAGLDLMGRRKDGTEFPVEISLSPLETPAGLLVTSIVRDVTGRRNAEPKVRGLLAAAPDAIVTI